MYNLSELIKTDCCIDCGTNEKLREVVGKIPKRMMKVGRIARHETHITVVGNDRYITGCHPILKRLDPIPLTSINIDL